MPKCQIETLNDIFNLDRTDIFVVSEIILKIGTVKKSKKRLVVVFFIRPKSDQWLNSWHHK